MTLSRAYFAASRPRDSGKGDGSVAIIHTELCDTHCWYAP